MKSGEPRTSIGSSREMSRCVCWWHSYSGLSKREIRLEECAVHPRVRWQPLGIAVLRFESRIVRYVVSQAKNRAYQVLVRENLFAQRHMSMFEAVVGLQSSFEPRKPVANLSVKCLAVGDEVGKNVSMIHVGEFGEEFGGFLGPDNVRGRNPFAKVISIGWRAGERDLVPVDGDAHLQSVESGRPGIEVGHPCAIVIIIAGIARAADGRAASVAHANVIAESRSS